jgi:cystathionine beta-lyase
LNTDEVAEPNIFATISAIEAFNNGDEWLDQLRKYVCENKKYVCERISKEIPNIKVNQSEATYLLWIDISKLGKDSADVAAAIRAKTGLYITEGIEYGEAGRYFLRMNVACTRATLEDGLNRLKNGI